MRGSLQAWCWCEWRCGLIEKSSGMWDVIAHVPPHPGDQSARTEPPPSTTPPPPPSALIARWAKEHETQLPATRRRSQSKMPPHQKKRTTSCQSSDTRHCKAVRQPPSPLSAQRRHSQWDPKGSQSWNSAAVQPPHYLTASPWKFTSVAD